MLDRPDLQDDRLIDVVHKRLNLEEAAEFDDALEDLADEIGLDLDDHE